MASYTVVDVSTFNTISNYSSAAKSVDGVIIRVGYRGYGSSGTLVKDNKFDTHYNGFKGKVPIGVYFLSQAKTKSEAEEEATFIYNIIRKLDIKFPVYLDSEYSNNSHTGRADGLSRADRTSMAIYFCEKIKSYGYKAGIYASDSWFKTNLDQSRFRSDYSLWVAKYSSASPTYVSKYDAWQYTSNGTISGCSGRVDLSHFYKKVWDGGDTPTPPSPSDEKINIATSGCSVYIPDSTCEYTGSPIEPRVYLLDKNDKKLTLDKDYNVKYSNNVNVGTASVTVTGIGKYKGTLNSSFRINAKEIGNLRYSVVPEKNTYTGSEVKPTIVIDRTTENKDYTLSYRNNINVGNAYAVATGIGNYRGTLEIPFYISPKGINDYSFTTEKSVYDYTGSEITPPVQSNLDASNYTVLYSNNINVGTANINITGTGNFNGSKQIHFEIKVLDISKHDIKVIDKEVPFDDGNPVKAKIEIEGLTLDKDYSVSYSNNIDIGIGKINVKGIGDYYGTNSAEFEIVEKDLSNIATIEFEDNEFYFTGQPIVPKITVNNANNADYTTVCKNNVDAGTATITVIFKSPYKGSVSENFEIQKRNLSTIYPFYGTFTPNSKYFIGDNTLELLTPAEYPLVEASDYEVESMEERNPEDINPDYSRIVDILIAAKEEGNFFGENLFSFKLINFDPGKSSTQYEKPETGNNFYSNFDDDCVYNYGDDDLDDSEEKLAEGDYDFTDLDNGTDPDTVVVDEQDYDFIDIDLIGTDDDYVYNFGELEIPEEPQAEGDYDFGDLDEGVDKDTVVKKNTDYDFNILSGDDPDESDLSPGTALELDDTPVYANFNSVVSSGRRSGIYFVYDKVMVNGRIRLTKLENGVGEPVRSTGWFNVSDLLELGKIHKGDTVKVEGELYDYPNGTGNYIIKKNDQMYVVDTRDPELYDYPYAVAQFPFLSPEGWASVKSVRKVIIKD